MLGNCVSQLVSTRIMDVANGVRSAWNVFADDLAVGNRATTAFEEDKLSALKTFTVFEFVCG